MSNQRDLDGDTPTDGISDRGVRIQAVQAKLRKARKHGLSLEEQVSIEALIVAIGPLLGEDGV